jgi:Zn-dependent M28 family amino/carboxypeptidase
MNRTKLAVALVLALLVALTAAGVATAAVTTDSSKLRTAVTTRAILQHERELQTIASANGGTRVAGSPGYDASVAYVADKLEAAGYDVIIQNFTFDAFVQNTPSVFELVSPTEKTYVEAPDGDFLTMDYSGSGDVTAPLAAADGIVFSERGGSESGCSAADFQNVTPGSVALVQRGTCTFRTKAENAQEAGAAGVIIFNEGNDDPNDDRIGVVSGTLDPPQMDIPVIGTSFAVGQDLYKRLQENQQVEVRLAVDAKVEEDVKTANVIADTRTGRADRTVVVGAHLDSVAEGPGINDNGSGTATILEVALQMSKLGIQPRNKVRFAFWGAEESGLLGSEHYVSSLSNSQRNDIAVNLNFDMVGSPNYGRFVYDGDGSDTPDAGPSGSGVVEEVFNNYFASQGLAVLPTAFDGRSDYGPFIDAGIPAGGLFTGAEDIKSADEAKLFGGTAGEAFDPCYHAACDDITNLNKTALDQMSDGVAHATLVFAQTGTAVGGTDTSAGTSSSSLKYKGPNAQK